MEPTRIPLPQLAGSLLELTGAEPPPYRALYGMVLDGTIPAELVRGRWRIDPKRLAAIAQILGMMPQPLRHRRGASWGSLAPQAPSRTSRRRPPVVAA